MPTNQYEQLELNAIAHINDHEIAMNDVTTRRRDADER